MKKITSPGTALVTGGAKRLGKAISLFLADQGYTIGLHYNGSRHEAQETAKKIERKGGQCFLVQADLDSQKQTLPIIRNVAKQHRDFNLLINNASIFEPSDLRSGSLDLLDRHWRVNCKAPYILSREFANICRRPGGQIINILDTHITQNTTQHFSYLLSKKSLASLTQMCAVELAPAIRVNAIAPGPILPPEGKSAAHLERLAQRVPLRRKGELSEITSCVKFLLENTYITGQIIYNDGGEHLL